MPSVTLGLPSARPSKSRLQVDSEPSVVGSLSLSVEGCAFGRFLYRVFSVQMVEIYPYSFRKRCRFQTQLRLGMEISTRGVYSFPLSMSLSKVAFERSVIEKTISQLSKATIFKVTT